MAAQAKGDEENGAAHAAGADGNGRVATQSTDESQVALKRPLLKACQEWYDQQMVARPLTTKTWTSFVLSTLSTVIGQLLERRWAPREAVKFGLIYCPPYSHFWYIYLDRWLGTGKHALLKTVLDQAIWQPLMLLKIFIFNGLWNGHSWPAVKESLNTGFRTAVLDGWKVWPLIQFVNMRYIPAVYQSSILDIICFFWDIYLSLLEARGRLPKKPRH